MKKVLFVPTYLYLSSPVFSRLLHELKDDETIYLDIEDQYPGGKTSSEFKRQFNRCVELSTKTSGRMFLKKFIKLFKMLQYKTRLKKLIEHENPDAIVTTSDLTFSLRIIKAYFPMIPIFIIQPALFPNKGIPRKFSQDIGYLFFNQILKLPLVQRQNYFGQEFDNVTLLVWGEYFKEMIRTDAKVFIVGDITLDDFPITKDLEARENFLSRYGYDKNTTTVTICTGAMESFVQQKTIDKLYGIYKSLISQHKDMFFIVKPHPRNDLQTLQDIFKPLNIENYVITDISLHELFKYTDIHVSSFSRTSIEAIASEIPVISINPDDEIQLQDFLNNQLCEKVTDVKEIGMKVEDILKYRAKYLSLGKEYIQNKLYRLDGNAAERAGKIIKSQIES